MLNVLVSFLIFVMIIFSANMWQRAYIENEISKKHFVIDQELQYGDVIFFSSSTPSFVNILSSFYFHDIFFHVGIILHAQQILHFINPNDCLFFNAHNTLFSESLVISNINDVINAYPDKTIIRVLRPPKLLGEPLQNVDIIEYAKDIGNNKQYDYHYVMSYLFGINDHTKLNCLTFIGVLLEKLGIFSKTINRVTTYVPGKILKLLLLKQYTLKYFQK